MVFIRRTDSKSILLVIKSRKSDANKKDNKIQDFFEGKNVKNLRFVWKGQLINTIEKLKAIPEAETVYFFEEEDTDITPTNNQPQNSIEDDQTTPDEVEMVAEEQREKVVKIIEMIDSGIIPPDCYYTQTHLSQTQVANVKVVVFGGNEADDTVISFSVDLKDEIRVMVDHFICLLALLVHYDKQENEQQQLDLLVKLYFILCYIFQTFQTEGEVTSFFISTTILLAKNVTRDFCVTTSIRVKMNDIYWEMLPFIHTLKELVVSKNFNGFDCLFQSFLSQLQTILNINPLFVLREIIKSELDTLIE